MANHNVKALQTPTFSVSALNCYSCALEQSPAPATLGFKAIEIIEESKQSLRKKYLFTNQNIQKAFVTHDHRGLI